MTHSYDATQPIPLTAQASAKLRSADVRCPVALVATLILGGMLLAGAPSTAGAAAASGAWSKSDAAQARRSSPATETPALPRADCPFDEYRYDLLSSGPLGVSIPDNEPTGIFVGWVQTAAEGLYLEDVIVDVNLSHSYAGDLALGLYYDTNNDNIGDVGPVMLMCTPGLVGCDFDGCCGCDGDLAGSYRFSDTGTGVLGEIDCTTVLSTGCYTVDPSYGPLHGFNGLADGGRFILYAWDWEAGDTGTVGEFTVWVRRGCNHPVLNVPADYPTVQGALDAACDGDTIRIAPGVYGDAIRDLRHKALTIEAAEPASPPRLGTIELDSLGSGGLRHLIADRVSLRAYSYFRITDLTTDSLYFYVISGDLQLTHSRLGGFRFEGFRAAIDSSVVGAMDFNVQDDVQLRNSTSGAVYIDFYGSGGAVITGNTFVDDLTDWRPVLTVRDYGDEVVLSRNLVVGAPDGAGVGILLDGEPSAPPVVPTCNDVWRCAQRWDGIADPTGVGGNFSADPRFCLESSEDYSLAAGSPCLPFNHPDGANCGLVGALAQGCSVPAAIEQTTEPFRSLVTAHPNPARTQVTFSMVENEGDAAVQDETRLRIFDAGGRMVRALTIPSGRGTRQVKWDQRNDAGDAVPAGVYFYRLSVGRSEVTRPLVVLR